MAKRTLAKRTVAMSAIVVVGLLAGSATASASSATVARGPLRDLQPTTVNATDDAHATVVAVEGRSHTFVLLVVRGLDPSAAGTTFGAHVHVGPCVAGDGAAAGPHYNSGGAVSASTEVWLDFVVSRGGTGRAHTIVPFVIPAGDAASVVVHAMPTDHTGAAGARQACLPVRF